MKTKRFVSVILVFVLVLSLAACAKKHTPMPTATTAPTPTTKPATDPTDTPAPSATADPTETPAPTEAPVSPTPTGEAEPTPTEEAANPSPVAPSPTASVTTTPVTKTPVPTANLTRVPATPTATSTPTPTATNTPTPTVTPTPLPNQLSAPAITANATGFTWKADKNATQYMVKVNNGEYKVASSVPFETKLGEYTISVKAIGDGTKYIDSNPSTLTYSVRETDLALTRVSGNTIAITYSAAGIMLDSGKGYAAYNQNKFAASEDCVAKVKTVTGWNEKEKVFYISEKEASETLVAAISKNFVIENGEGKSASDLADDWDIKKYVSGWIDTAASIGIKKSYNAANGNCVTMDCWSNGYNFRYSHGFSIGKCFDAIEFDIKGNDVITLKVQLMNYENGVYTTYPIGTLSSEWTHYVISVLDDNWYIDYNNQKYRLDDAVAFLGMNSYYEMVPSFDILNFVFYGESENGANAHVYVDNIELSVGENKTTSVTKIAVPTPTPTPVVHGFLFDFEEQQGGGESYENKNSAVKWVKSQYKDIGDGEYGWAEINGGLNSYTNSDTESKVLGMTTGWGSSYMYRLESASDSKLGTFDKIEFDMGAYKSTSSVKVKFAWVDKNDNTHYLMGSAESMQELSTGLPMTLQSFSLGGLKEVKAIYFCVYSADSGGDHLFIDNLKLMDTTKK